MEGPKQCQTNRIEAVKRSHDNTMNENEICQFLFAFAKSTSIRQHPPSFEYDPWSILCPN